MQTYGAIAMELSGPPYSQLQLEVVALLQRGELDAAHWISGCTRGDLTVWGWKAANHIEAEKRQRNAEAWQQHSTDQWGGQLNHAGRSAGAPGPDIWAQNREPPTTLGNNPWTLGVETLPPRATHAC
jgi:hypothetical protein